MPKFFDWWLFLPASLLSLLGLLVIFGISPEEFNHQLLFLGLAVGLFWFFTRLGTYFFTSFAYLAYGLVIFLLVVTHVFGVFSRGSVRWLDLGIFRLQPSEIAKPILVLAFALFASRVDLSKAKNLAIFFGFLALPFLLVFKQPDLGSALVIAVLWGAILLARGTLKRWSLVIVLGLVVLLPLFWTLLKPYQKERITSFLQPGADPLGASYNQIQAKIAVGAGQIMGKGLGSGSQANLAFLPEHQTDFIFASFAEELGFFGSLALLLLYAIILTRLLVLVGQTDEIFNRLVLLGIFAFLWFQITTHIGMNLGLLPVTGIPLPFISVGGSSLVSSWISLGIASAVSGFRFKQKTLEIR